MMNMVTTYIYFCGGHFKLVGNEVQSFSEGLKHEQFKQRKSFPEGVSQRAIIFPTQKSLNLPKINSVVGDAQVQTFSELIKKQQHG